MRSGRSATPSTFGVLGSAIPCRNTGLACRRGHLRRPDERQRLTTMSAARSTGSKSPCASSGPFLGICLGAQMLAKQLGAQVAPRITKGGWRSATIRSARRSRARALPGTGRARLPLARRGISTASRRKTRSPGDDFPVQAYQHGHAFGFNLTR
jgi:hypothetical protein